MESPLDDANGAFHALYDRARGAAELDGPVFVLLSDTLVVYRHAQRQALSFAPRAFHLIKAVAHAPTALFAALHRLTPDPSHAPHAHQALAALRTRVVASLASLEQEPGLDAETLDDLRTVLAASSSFLDRPLGAADSRELERFARELGPILQRLLDRATRIQLAALHEHVERALRQLEPNERAALQVVVTGDHQARQRSLPMQYFQKRLREPAGSEERVTYAEGVCDERQALALVGTRRLDRALALAFFGDRKRLQRDLLGDAAQRLLEAAELTPIP